MLSTRNSTPVSTARRVLFVSLLSATSVYAGLPTMSYAGCFSSSQPLTDQGSYQYQTQGWCQPICIKQNQAVLGLSGGSDCWCGGELPSSDTKVDDSNCDTPCNGYDKDMCGGTNYYSVYLTGTETSVGSYDGSSDSSSSEPSSSAAAPSSTAEPTSAPSSSPPPAVSSPAPSSASTASAAPIVVTSVKPGQTIVVTEPASQHAPTSGTPTPTESAKHSGGGGSNVAGIAAGVVVGVVGAAAIIAGLVFWLRHRRRQAAEDEYKRSTQVNDFMRGGEGKPPATGYSNMSDSRLDPEAGRRNSQGSIADAEDYSRRILRVANPDDS